MITTQVAAPPRPPRKTKPGLVITVAASVVVLLVMGWRASHVNPDSPSSAAVELDADVKFTGLEFTIRNRSNVDWTNATAEINGSVNGYEYSVGAVAAGHIVQIGASQFVRRSGERFNAIQTTPQEFRIYAETPDGRGMWLGGWK